MQKDCLHQLMKILDGFSEYVYVADIKTHELYYLNKAAQEKFHVSDYEGKKCFTLLQGKSSPCSFCNNMYLSKSTFYEWELRNDWIQSHGLLKDILIDWDGHEARLEIARNLRMQDEQLRQITLAHEMEKVTLQCVQMLYESNDPKEAMDAILRMLGEFMQADRAYVFEIQDDLLYNTCEWCKEGIEQEKDNLQAIDVRLIDVWMSSFERRECYVVSDIEDLRDADFELYQMLHMQKIKTLAVVPVIMKNKVIGYIGVDNPALERVKMFPMLDTLGYFCSLSFEKRQSREEIARRSFEDMLTGLKNRNCYMRMLSAYDSTYDPIYGVVYMDINDLKGTNDHLGHEYGDHMIKEAAGYLSQVFGDKHTYRIGGDEFVAFSHSSDQQKLKEQVEQLSNLFHMSNSCTAAIGWVWKENGNLHEMIKEADESMYCHKKEYYRTHLDFHRYRPTHDETLCLQVPSEVEKAIRNQRFHFYLQPKTSMDAKTIIGSEALVRYENHHGDILSPIEFIPVLEQARTICYVDFYMFMKACETIQTWQKEGFCVKPISVNFSRYTLAREHFLQELNEIWARYHIDKKLIEIEIIERIGNINGEHLIRVMNAIKKEGFGVSIDDFGVKYSNLFLFSNTNIDTLKLDRSLIMDLHNNSKSQMIIKTLSTLCAQFHIQLIVEGVETKEQLKILNQLDCDGIQGYLVSKPIPLPTFTDKFVK